MADLNATEVALLLALQRTGPGTRASMGRLLGCSPATVFRASDALASAGWIGETPVGNTKVGRRPGLMRIRPEAAYVVAMHLSADRTLVSIVDADLEVIALDTKAVDLHHEGPEDLFDALDPVIEGLLRARGLTWTDVRAIGMALAGRTDFESGRPVTPPNMPLWHGRPLREEMLEHWGLPAVLDNDANLMALGETLRGFGAGIPHFMFVNVDLGIGAGLVMDGRLYRGTRGFSGELGHTRVAGATATCACGKRGCLQTVASTPAVLVHARARAKRNPSGPMATAFQGPHPVGMTDIAEAADRGDPAALAVISETGAAVGEILSGAINLLNPSLIVLGGSTTALGNGLLAAIRKSVARDTIPGSAEGLAIKFSRVGERAALIGAAALSIELIVSRLADGSMIAARPQAV